VQVKASDCDTVDLIEPVLEDPDADGDRKRDNPAKEHVVGHAPQDAKDESDRGTAVITQN